MLQQPSSLGVDQNSQKQSPSSYVNCLYIWRSNPKKNQKCEKKWAARERRRISKGIRREQKAVESAQNREQEQFEEDQERERLEDARKQKEAESARREEVQNARRDPEWKPETMSSISETSSRTTRSVSRNKCLEESRRSEEKFNLMTKKRKVDDTASGNSSSKKRKETSVVDARVAANQATEGKSDEPKEVVGLYQMGVEEDQPAAKMMTKNKAVKKESDAAAVRVKSTSDAFIAQKALQRVQKIKTENEAGEKMQSRAML